ncbi:MAG TPA: SDR family oxidoreductase [Methylotenera sp.]
MTAVLVTGANGFVGAAVLQRLALTNGFSPRAAVRNAVHAQQVSIDLAAPGNWQQALQGLQCVVHCAARVHVMNDSSSDPLTAFRKINVEGTLSLARQAAAAGVKRFIFLSSVKVNGEQTLLGQPYSADATPAPLDAYGVSKLEAEQALRGLGAETGMEMVIIRPVLVYGPGVGANFHSMMSWLAKGIPLPLGAIHNLRSLVAVDNLVDLIVTCIEHPAAANQTFLVSDDEDVSTSQLLRRLAAALGKPVRLLPLPAWLLATVATLLGKRAVAQRLCGSLQVDISKTKAVLGWAPPVTLDLALQRTATHFLEQ